MRWLRQQSTYGVSWQPTHIVTSSTPTLQNRPCESLRSALRRPRQRIAMHKRRWLVHCILTGVLLWGWVLIPDISPAHPLGNFSISHYTGIQIVQDSIELRYVLDMAEIPTFQELQDTGLIPEVGHPSVHGYLAQKTEALQAGLLLEVHGRRLTLQVVSSEILFPPGAGGLPTLKLGVVYRTPLDPAPADTLYYLHYQDSNFPGRAGWQEIIARTSPGITLIR